MAEQFDLWGGDVQPKQTTQKQTKSNEPATVPTPARMSVSAYAQTPLTETSPAIHYVVLVNKAASDIQDLRRHIKFEEEKRLKLEEQVNKLTKAVLAIQSELKIAIETINEIVKQDEEDARDAEVELDDEGDEE